MKNIGYAILLVVGAVGIIGTVVARAMEGNWWSLFLLGVLWPMRQAATVVWSRGFGNNPAEQDPPDGRGERPTDPNELAKWIVEQSTDDSQSSSNDASEGQSS